MGGSAFSAGAHPLYTPRMPKNIYHTVKSRCHAALRERFYCVASPIDGPAKKDFGDVDILVAWPKEPITSRQEALNDISSLLQATRIIDDKGKDISGHLAIPWPDEALIPSQSSGETPESVGKLDRICLSEGVLIVTDDGCPDPVRRPNMTENESQAQINDFVSEEPELLDLPKNSETQNQKRFIQVDVRICNSLQHLQWMLFKHAHGDIWNLLGTTIRPYGLTVDEEALWLRVPEIEYHNRNRAKVFLSSDPVEILHFLGLPIEGYWEIPFEDPNAMYEYAALCRMFWVQPLDPEDGTGDVFEQDRKKLKANDRRRMNQRPGFRKWVEDFKPQCREEGRFLIKPTTREAITEEAFAWFHVEGEFTRRRDEFLLEKQKEMIWRDIIKGSLPAVDPSNQRAINFRSCLVKALKRIILEEDDRYGILPDTKLTDGRGFYVIESVVDFISRRQEEIGKAAWSLNQDQYAESRKRKASRGSESTSPEPE